MVEIRQGTEADVGAVVAFALPILRELGLESSPAAILDTAYRRYLGRDESLWLVARESRNGDLVGTVIAQLRGGGLTDGFDAFVEAVAVRPDLRHQGLGDELLGRVESWAYARGARGLYVMIPAASPMKPPADFRVDETWYRKELQHG